jgi:FKBP-type peptidyl-prolyl cis-trans isomerase FkpA
MKVCSVCNEIVPANQRCVLSNCPNKGSARPAPKSGKVTPGPTGRSDRAVQAGLDRAGDVARQATRRTVFAGAAILSVAVAAAVLLLTNTEKFDSNTAQNASKQKSSSDVVTTPSGLRYKIIQTGKGPTPTENDVVLVSYKGMLKDGTVFDQNPQAGFPVTGVIPGFSEGLKIMQRGGKYRLWIPADLGYGPEDQRNPQTGEVAIPGGSELTFDVELLEFKSRAEIEAMQKEMQKGNVGSDG